MKAPSKNHNYALVRDVFGNASVVIKCGRHLDYIYGLFKGKECFRRDDAYFEEWYREGDQVPLSGHPTKGDVVLVMGKPGVGDVTEISGDAAQKIIAGIVKNN